LLVVVSSIPLFLTLASSYYHILPSYSLSALSLDVRLTANQFPDTDNIHNIPLTPPQPHVRGGVSKPALVSIKLRITSLGRRVRQICLIPKYYFWTSCLGRWLVTTSAPALSISKPSRYIPSSHYSSINFIDGIYHTVFSSKILKLSVARSHVEPTKLTRAIPLLLYASTQLGICCRCSNIILSSRSLSNYSYNNFFNRHNTQILKTLILSIEQMFLL